MIYLLQESVEHWPVCDCLISFHSKGFPLEKAIQYAQLRKPYVINNLHMQYDIQDRRKVYSILESVGIEIPRYAVLDRDSPDPKRTQSISYKNNSSNNIIDSNNLSNNQCNFRARTGRVGRSCGSERHHFQQAIRWGAHYIWKIV